MVLESTDPGARLPGSKSQLHHLGLCGFCELLNASVPPLCKMRRLTELLLQDCGHKEVSRDIGTTKNNIWPTESVCYYYYIFGFPWCLRR